MLHKKAYFITKRHPVYKHILDIGRVLIIHSELICENEINIINFVAGIEIRVIKAFCEMKPIIHPLIIEITRSSAKLTYKIVLFSVCILEGINK